jgi:hypothetical protein
MAENRGGANGGPQYNPANVSGTGGAGQSGKYKGFAYGQNKQINNQISQGDAAVSSVSSGQATQRNLPPMESTPVTPVTASTANPNESVMAGLTPYGQPNNPNELALPVQTKASDPEEAMIRDYFPTIEFWANQPGVSDTTKEYAAYLRTIL